MKSIQNYKITKNEKLTKDIYKMVLEGDTSWITNPGQFINITIENCYLKRPISICDWDDTTCTIIYKVVGKGTEIMSLMKQDDYLEALVDLGNGFNINVKNDEVLLVGGGVGIPPLFGLTKHLVAQGKKCHIIMGFNTKEECFYVNEFKSLNVDVIVCTADGTYGVKGFVNTAIKNGLENLYYFSCGPLPMLKAVFDASNAQGQLSFEERMGCGFGACMGCSCKTLTGYKRICVEGPVMKSEEILWNKD